MKENFILSRRDKSGCGPGDGLATAARVSPSDSDTGASQDAQTREWGRDELEYVVRAFLKERSGNALCSLASLATGVSVYSRTNRHSSQPDGDCGKVGKSLEVTPSPFISRGETSEVLEPIEATFDAVAMSVGFRIVRNDDLA